MSTVNPPGRAGGRSGSREPGAQRRFGRHRSALVSETLVALRTPAAAARSARHPIETARHMLDRVRRR